MTAEHTAHLPEILTPRLRLRAFGSSDLDAYAAIVADEDVTRHLGDGRRSVVPTRGGAAAALDFARTECRPERIVSLIRSGNAGSIKVAERLGGILDGDVEFIGGRSLVYNYRTIG
jgi:RimJ/RimL family protein N-acetyltransferase